MQLNHENFPLPVTLLNTHIKGCSTYHTTLTANFETSSIKVAEPIIRQNIYKYFSPTAGITRHTIKSA